MNNFKLSVAQLLSKNLNMVFNEIEDLLEIPPNPDMGDFAFPCFTLSKTLRKAPNLIAQELKESLYSDLPNEFEKVENSGPYLNFYINKNMFIESIIADVLSKGEKFGSSDIGKNKNVIIEYSSVNIAKAFHIGHLLNTVIGNSLYKIYDFLGYNTIRINHLGDWGTQFGKLIVAYKMWGNKEEVQKEPFKKLTELYVRFHSEAESNPDLEDEARAANKAIEDGVKEYVDIWQWFKDVSLEEVKQVYKVLNIDFDSWNGESFYIDKIPAVVEELQQKGLLKESEGAQVVDLEAYGMPPCIIKRSDGATLYATRDLAAAFYRKKTYNFDKCLYVVGTPQILHFKQVFKVVELMGYEWAKDMIHINYGTVSLESGKMSTRKGTVILLEDVLKEAIGKVQEIIEQRNPNLENKEDTAKKVGIGAVVFGSLINNRIKDVVFTWDKVLNFEGETGPYVQYTYARICSIFRKVGYDNPSNIDYSLLNNSESLDVVRQLAKFPQVVEDAAIKNEPSLISRYVIDLCQSFNSFYHNNPVIGDNKILQDTRLSLCKSVRTIISNSMGLLGIECPERM